MRVYYTAMVPSFSAEITPHLASRGARLVGQILDELIAFGIFLIIILPSIFGGEGSGFRFLNLLALALLFLYILFSDGFHGGQSIGKKPLKLAVVDATTGEPCTYWKSFLRNIFLVLGAIDWIFIFGEKRQRLGDMVANTIVIDRG